MSVETTIQLISFIALALPAIGIYMTLNVETREKYKSEITIDRKGEDAYTSPHGHAYHGMRVSILSFVAAALAFFLHLLIIRPSPYALNPGLSTSTTTFATEFIFYAGVGSLAFALITFGLSIAFQQLALQDDLDIKSSLRIIYYQQPRAVVFKLLGWEHKLDGVDTDDNTPDEEDPLAQEPPAQESD